MATSLGIDMGALTVTTWRVCLQLTPEETTGIELATQKLGCISKDDDHDLIIMVRNLVEPFLHILLWWSQAVPEEERGVFQQGERAGCR